jgi:DNA replication protein DnaC
MRSVSDILGNMTPPEGDREDRGARAVGAGRAEEVCPICKGKGFLIYDVPPGHPDFNRLAPCRCTEARQAVVRLSEMREISKLGALKRMTFDSFLPEGVGVPQSVRASLRKAYDMSYRFARDPVGWLVLLGGYGVGKTHLAAAIASHNLDLGKPAMFVVVPDLLDYLRASFSPNSEIGLDERLDAIRETPLLILDDLGAHHSTPWAQEKLYQIINHRYNARLATVVTTNQRLEEIDPRISSRLVDNDVSELIEIQAPDFRGGHANTLGLENRGGRNLNTLEMYSDRSFEGFSLRLQEEMLAEQRRSLRDALEQARSYAEDTSGWIVFTGAYGCGKTHLAAAIANEQVHRKGMIPVFVVVPDLLDHLRGTFAPDSTISLDRAFEQIKTAPLLVLDDLGTENATAWAKEKLFQLFNHRYVARMPTIITTHHTLDKLDPHIASRMEDVSRCTVVAISAPTYRGSDTQRTIHRTRRK